MLPTGVGEKYCAIQWHRSTMKRLVNTMNVVLRMNDDAGRVSVGIYKPRDHVHWCPRRAQHRSIASRNIRMPDLSLLWNGVFWNVQMMHRSESAVMMICANEQTRQVVVGKYLQQGLGSNATNALFQIPTVHSPIPLAPTSSYIEKPTRALLAIMLASVCMER
jgi:hypothetical protein